MFWHAPLCTRGVWPTFWEGCPSLSAFFSAAFSTGVRKRRRLTTVSITTAWLRLLCAFRWVKANALRGEGRGERACVHVVAAPHGSRQQSRLWTLTQATAQMRSPAARQCRHAAS